MNRDMGAIQSAQASIKIGDKLSLARAPKIRSGK
jgi:hypothetical protein